MGTNAIPQPRLYFSIHTHLSVRFFDKNRIRHPRTSRDPFERVVCFYQDNLLRHASVPITAQAIRICTTYNIIIARYPSKHQYEKRCRHLQVILRPHPSTSGRNIQQRLFLRQQFNPRHLSGLSILESCVKQRINSNLDVVVLLKKM